jgi:hypothetical protein
MTTKTTKTTKALNAKQIAAKRTAAALKAHKTRGPKGRSAAAFRAHATRAMQAAQLWEGTPVADELEQVAAQRNKAADKLAPVAA